MLTFVKFVLVMTFALQCQGFCGKDDHYTKVPKVKVANSTHLKVSWHGLFSGCHKSDILKMSAVSTHTPLQGKLSIITHSGLDFDDKEGYLALNPCLEHEVYLELASYNRQSYRMSKKVKYNDVSRPDIVSLYGRLLPEENFMENVCLKEKGMITFPDPPKAISKCILTRGDLRWPEFTYIGQKGFVPMKILHPTNQTELEITAQVNRIIDCALTTQKPTPTTNNQNISSPSSNDRNVQIQQPHQPVAIFIASILGTLAVAAVVTTALCCFKKKRSRVPASQPYDVNPVYGTVYYHQDRCV